jgi:hypothetical protein
VYATRDVLAAEKAVPTTVVATIERGRPFIDAAVSIKAKLRRFVCH